MEPIKSSIRCNKFETAARNTKKKQLRYNIQPQAHSTLRTLARIHSLHIPVRQHNPCPYRTPLQGRGGVYLHRRLPRSGFNRLLLSCCMYSDQFLVSCDLHLLFHAPSPPDGLCYGRSPNTVNWGRGRKQAFGTFVFALQWINELYLALRCLHGCAKRLLL